MATRPRSFMQKFKGNPFAYAGIPLLGLVVGGSLFLSTFTQTHVELKDQRNKSQSVRQFNLEEEHSKLIKKLDIDNFTLSRIPRPEDADKDKSSSKSARS